MLTRIGTGAGRIYADLAQKLIERARQLYAQDKLEVALDETVYALDSTTIDLCLELFPWARFRRRKAAIKLHTLLDLRGSIPTDQCQHIRENASARAGYRTCYYFGL